MGGARHLKVLCKCIVLVFGVLFYDFGLFVMIICIVYYFVKSLLDIKRSAPFLALYRLCLAIFLQVF